MPKRSRVKPIATIDDPRYVKALAHPLRIRILALLGERNASPVQISEHLEATLGTVAYHVRVLENLGLIELTETHQRRGATEHVYAAREHPQISDQAWMAASPITKQVVVTSVLAQVGAYATQSATSGGFDRSDAHLSRSSLKMDEKGWAELAAASKKWLAEVERIGDRTRARLDRSGDAGFDVGAVMMLFEAKGFFDTATPSAPPGRTVRQPSATNLGRRR